MKETILISLPIDDLQTIIIDCVNSCLKYNRNYTQEPIIQDKFFDIKEAADFIKLSVPSMYRLCNEKKIPNLKKGGKILFSKEELIRWAKEGRRKTITEINESAEKFLGTVGQKKAANHG